MAGISTTNASNSADADGTTTVFNFTFFVYSTDHIKVYSVLNDVLTEITSGFTAAINSSFIGGTVTFDTAPADAVGNILVRREVPYTQTTEFADLTRYKETAIEEALNTLVMQVQQVQADVSRSLKYTETSGVTDATIETPEDGTVLLFDGTTGRIEAGTTVDDIESAQTYANAASASASSASVSAAAAAASAAEAELIVGADMQGPSGATDGSVALFDGTTGKLLKEGPEIGTSANNLVQLDGDAKLPAVDGSLLTGLTTIPSGIVVDFAGDTAPSGWLLCYGQAISRTVYTDLFTAIGTTYGLGDGSTTFNVPDCRGRVTAGKDNMGGTSANRLTDQTGGLNGDVLGDIGGSETHTLLSGELASHTHPQYAPSTTEGGSLYGSPFDTDNGPAVELTGVDTGATGSGLAHNNVQPTIVLNKIIKI